MSTLADKAQTVSGESGSRTEPMRFSTPEGDFTCHTSQAVAGVGEAVKADAQELKYFTEDYIVEHPLKTAGIALGVGFLLGVLWTRR